MKVSLVISLSSCPNVYQSSQLPPSSTISNRPSNPLSAFLLCLRFGFGWPLCGMENRVGQSYKEVNTSSFHTWTNMWLPPASVWQLFNTFNTWAPYTHFTLEIFISKVKAKNFERELRNENLQCKRALRDESIVRGCTNVLFALLLSSPLHDIKAIGNYPRSRAILRNADVKSFRCLL